MTQIFKLVNFHMLRAREDNVTPSETTTEPQTVKGNFFGKSSVRESSAVFTCNDALNQAQSTYYIGLKGNTAQIGIDEHPHVECTDNGSRRSESENGVDLDRNPDGFFPARKPRSDNH